jgi:hypothetical protein
MFGYIPIGLIMAGTDPYGPTGELAGRKSHRLISFDWLRPFQARRSAPKAAPQISPAQHCCAAPGRPVI